MAQPSKRDAILKTAGDLFVAQGFSKVSIDQIARAVPVSKPTLYAHFPDKRALYAAVITARCALLLGNLTQQISSGDDIATTLTTIGNEFLEALLKDSTLQMHRTLTGEIASFPEIAALFYESGPKQMHAYVMRQLQEADEKNLLTVPNADLSADMFLSSIKGYAHLRRLLGVSKPLTAQAKRERVDYAVALFIKAHAVV